MAVEKNKPYSDISDPFTRDPMRVFTCGAADVLKYANEFLEAHWHEGWGAVIVSPRGKLDIPPEQVRNILKGGAFRVSYIGANKDAGRYFIGVSE
ncbi:MAG: hypothetical protein NC311_19155 [Muribaculaceae bacterium]|nr:hypothetical protein [Muribaculaceae bacterium]